MSQKVSLKIQPNSSQGTWATEWPGFVWRLGTHGVFVLQRSLFVRLFGFNGSSVVWFLEVVRLVGFNSC